MRHVRGLVLPARRGLPPGAPSIVRRPIDRSPAVRPPRRLVLLALLLALAACADDRGGWTAEQAAPWATHPDAPAGTRRMAALLRDKALQTDPFDNVYLNAARAAEYERQFEAAGGAENVPLEDQVRYAFEHVLRGEPRQGLELLQAHRRRFEGFASAANPQVVATLRRLTALAWMRVGEQENCVLHHGPESCIVPMAAGGLHAAPEGSRNARDLFLEAVRADPEDWEARWLLNIAAMTLGEWPDGVPDEYLVPPEVFASEADIGRFPDVAGRAGVEAFGLAGGACLEDFDGDGLLDIVSSSWGMGDPLVVLKNEGDGRFSDRTEASRLAGITGGLNMVHADPDNDGDADVLVLRGGWFEKDGGHPNSLLRNEGGLVFSDVTEEVGLLSFHPTQAGAWGDWDGDGWLDLFVGNESGTEEHPCELFVNQGDGTFRDEAARLGVDKTAFVKGAVWGDLDNDGDLDLYVSRIDGDNWLLRNDGHDARRPFVDVAQEAGVTEPKRSFPCWVFDHDNDGWLDIFVSGYKRGATDHIARDVMGLPSKGVRARLYRNRQDGTFADVSEEAGVRRVLATMGCNHGDFDNDGWPDFYLGTGEPDFGALYPNRAFRNDRGVRFQDITTSGGFGHLQKGHGVTFGDVDNDGDQDLYVDIGGAFEDDGFRNALFLNPGHGRRWLTLRLEGVAANRSAIGARLRVRIAEPAEDTPGGGAGALVERDVHAVVGTGGSFGSSSLQAELGLGEAVAVKELEVRWPGSGLVQTFTDVPLDAFLELREGGELRTVERPLVPLGQG